MANPKINPSDADLTDDEFAAQTRDAVEAIAILLGDHDPTFCACVLATCVATLGRYTQTAYAEEWKANGGFDGWWTAFTSCVLASAMADEQTEMRAVLGAAGIKSRLN